MSFAVEIIRCLDNNCAVILHGNNDGTVVLIDAPEFAPINQALKARNWQLDIILVTHHHMDHTQAIGELKENYDCQVWGPPGITGVDKPLADGDKAVIAGDTLEVMATPGHTLDHLCYYFRDNELLFAGDTLMVMGCGKIFEGTADDMHKSLTRLAGLPDSTRIYCGHDLALDNAKFAISIDPGNVNLQKRMQNASAARQQKKMFMPSTVGEEKQSNPFLRTDTVTIRAGLGLEPDAAEVVTLAELRGAKDRFVA